MNQTKRNRLQASSGQVQDDESTGAMLSCLLDGELEPDRCDQALERLRRDAQALRDWELMSIASDALHSSEVAAWHRADFAQRLRGALDAEPTVLAPRPSRHHWQRWVGTGAAVAAAGALVFVGMAQLQSRVDGPATIAKAEAQPQPITIAAPAVPPEPLVERLPAMERYLAAHRELARPAVMPDATPYLRTSATVRLEGPGR